MSAAVAPEKVLRDLHDLWAQLAQNQSESGGVLRACAMTLVVTAKDSADASRIHETVGVLMHNHPCRAIILCPRTDGSLNARVFSECWKPFGKTQQICSEGIEITPGDDGLAEVARFLVPLKVPDLPVVLWCRGKEKFDPLFDLADKIVFDTSGTADAEAALSSLRNLRNAGHRVADLHWTRLTGWREVLANLVDTHATDVSQVAKVTVNYGGESAATCARYFAAWIRTSLPSANVALESELGTTGLQGVTLESPQGKLSIRKGNDQCIEVSGCGQNYRSQLPSTTEESLMQEELGILGVDPIYERALAA